MNRIETDLVRPTSNRQVHNEIYQVLGEYALPGDVVFFITEEADDEPVSKLKARVRQIARPWRGLAAEDNSQWHIGIYSGVKEERKGSRKRPTMYHSTKSQGVNETHIQPSYYTNSFAEDGQIQRHRVEMLHFNGITLGQQEAVVDYAKKQQGKSFPKANWTHDLPTYALGIPSRKLDPNELSCIGLVFGAYSEAGINFSHPLSDFPWFNIARVIGHPLGHTLTHVEPSRQYLYDYHLYRDPRFEVRLAVHQDPETKAYKTDLDPGKYSWNSTLQRGYGFN